MVYLCIHSPDAVMLKLNSPDQFLMHASQPPALCAEQRAIMSPHRAHLCLSSNCWCFVMCCTFHREQAVSLERRATKKKISRWPSELALALWLVARRSGFLSVMDANLREVKRPGSTLLGVTGSSRTYGAPPGSPRHLPVLVQV